MDSSFSATSSPAIAVTNYDVLLDRPPSVGAGYTEDQLEKNKGHAGNNRLKVFLNLYQQAYDGARQNGDINECNSIVSKIVNTVCQQCVPQGRFMVEAASSSSDAAPAWRVMEENQIKNLIHAILRPEKPPASAVGGFATTRPKKPPVSAVGGFSCTRPQQGVGDGQKRRRRSSLLRRSASESMLGMALDAKKKIKEIKEESTWSSSRSNKNGVTSLNRMDVILTSSRDALDPNSQSVGNNRLHILVAMQSGKYQEATVDGREAILDEVIQTVNTFWKGKFLTESSNGYEELGKDVSRNALRSIFDMRSGQNLLTSRQRISGGGVESPIVPDRNLAHAALSSSVGQASMSSLPVGAMGIRNPKMGLIKQVSTSTIPGGCVPIISTDTKMGLARQVSTSIIPTQLVPMALPEVGELRSAAVKSLQKQKARQFIASRLEKGSRRHNHTLVHRSVESHNYRDNPSSQMFGRLSISGNSNQNFASNKSSMASNQGSISGGVDRVASLKPVGEDAATPLSAAPSSISTMVDVGQAISKTSFDSMVGKGNLGPGLGLVAQKRQSTVLGKLDSRVMEQLVADFDEADCNDEEPFPY